MRVFERLRGLFGVSPRPTIEPDGLNITPEPDGGVSLLPEQSAGPETVEQRQERLRLLTHQLLADSGETHWPAEREVRLLGRRGEIPEFCECLASHVASPAFDWSRVGGLKQVLHQLHYEAPPSAFLPVLAALVRHDSMSTFIRSGAGVRFFIWLVELSAPTLTEAPVRAQVAASLTAIRLGSDVTWREEARRVWAVAEITEAERTAVIRSLGRDVLEQLVARRFEELMNTEVRGTGAGLRYEEARRLADEILFWGTSHSHRVSVAVDELVNQFDRLVGSDSRDRWFVWDLLPLALSMTADGHKFKAWHRESTSKVLHRAPNPDDDYWVGESEKAGLARSEP